MQNTGPRLVSRRKAAYERRVKDLNHWKDQLSSATTDDLKARFSAKIEIVETDLANLKKKLGSLALNS